MPLEKTSRIAALPERSVPVGLAPIQPEFAGSDEADWNHRIHMLATRWPTLLATLALVVLGTMLWLVRTVPVYEASARVQITVQSPDYATLKDSTSASVDDNQLVNTYVAVIQGETLAKTAIADFHMDELPEFAGPHRPGRLADVIQAFEKHLVVRRVPETRLVQITFSSVDPSLAAKVANGLANELIDFELQQNYDSATKATGWLGKELEALQRQVEESDQALVNYEEQNQIVNVDDRQTITTQKLSQLNQDLTQAIADRIAAQASYDSVINGSGAEGARDNATDTLIPQLRQQRSVLGGELAKLEANQLGPNYPQVKELQQQINAIDAAIGDEQQRIVTRVTQAYTSSTDRENLLRSAVAEQTKTFNELSQKLVQYQILKRQAESKHQLYDGLLQKQREAAVSVGITSSRVDIVDPAQEPIRPARPKRVLDLAMSVVMGLLLGVLLVFGRDYLDRTIKTIEHLEWIGAQPILGMVPRFETGPSAFAAMSRTTAGSTIIRNRNVELDAYRNIRTALQLSSLERPARVIAISSAVPGEGKSTCVANVAYTYAQIGERVLIVDADLRRPSQHVGFRTPRSPGLANVLLGECEVAVATVATDVSNLYLLPAGRRVTNPSELLQSKSFVDLIGSLQKQYDRILVDCTPLLGLSDGLLGCSVADIPLIIVRSGVTHKDALRRIFALCRQTNLEPGGFILNGFSHESGYGYGDGYYRSKYYDAEPDAADEEEVESATLVTGGKS